MKKKTNRILLIVFLSLVLLCILVTTLSIQLAYYLHPYIFNCLFK